MGSVTAEEHDKLIESGELPLEEKEEEDLEDEELEEGKEQKKDEEKEKGYVFDGDDIPEELRGLTPAQVVQHYQQVVGVAKGLAARAAAAPVTPAVEEKEVEPPKLTQDDLLDADSLSAKLSDFVDAKAKPYVAQLAQVNATTNYNDAFTRNSWLEAYKAEFDQAINQLTVDAIANPATVELLVGRVRNAHFEELAIEYAQRKTKPIPPDSERGKSITKPLGDNDEPNLDAEEKRVARAMGVTYKAYATMKPFTTG